jgi:hypothetical protein
MRGHLKKIERLSPCFPHSMRPIPKLTTCLSSPGARMPVFVPISMDLPRKRRVMTENVNVSQGKTKTKKMER